MQVRQAFRSGTWQFMSAELLDNPKKLNTLQDDLQSFFWLLLYYILRYMDHNRTHGLAENMKNIFDSALMVPLGEPPMGGASKFCLLREGTPLTQDYDDFEVFGNPHLTALYDQVRMYFKDWDAQISSHKDELRTYRRVHQVSLEVAKEKVPLKTEHLPMHNHQAMIRLFEEGLKDAAAWPEGDFFSDRFPEPTPTLMEPGAQDVEENEDANVDEPPKKTTTRRLNQVESDDSPKS